MDFVENQESTPPQVKNPEVVENEVSADLHWSKVKSGCSGPPLTASLCLWMDLENAPQGHGFLGTEAQRWVLEHVT